MEGEPFSLQATPGELPKSISGNIPDPEQDRKTYNLFILYQASRALSAVLEVEELLELSLDMTTEVMNTAWGLFYLMSEEQDALELRKSKGIDAKTIPSSLHLAEGMVDWAKGKMEPFSFDELIPEMPFSRSFPDLRNLTQANPYFLIPIFHQLRFIGLIVLGRRLDGGVFTENDLELLSTLVSLSANAIMNAHLYELAILDGTTKLFVVRYFRQRMREEIKRASRYTQPLTLLMLDLDLFKLVNDTYGHPSGDKVLADVGAIVRKCTREYVDIPCRYGGEEFAVLLPETDTEGGYHVAERIRKMIDKTRFLKENIRITISAGLASYPTDADTDEELVERADLALYEAKRLGRNRVVAHDQSAIHII